MKKSNDYSVWCEVVCDNCCNTSAGSFYYKGNKTISNLRRIAKKDGWKIINGKTLCPNCVDKCNNRCK